MSDDQRFLPFGANKMDNSKPFSREGYELMGAAFEVYNVVGFSLLEEVYQESLEIELELRGIPCQPREELILAYKGRQLRKRYIPDLYVHGGIVVELKSVSAIAPEHEAQLFNYLRIARKSVGYLINFGAKGDLEWKRFLLSEYVGQNLNH